MVEEDAGRVVGTGVVREAGVRDTASVRELGRT